MSLVIKSGNREITVATADGNILEAAQKAGVPVESSCGGRGVCGKCSVFLEEGTYRIFGETVTVAPGERREELACVTCLAGPDARIAVPREAALESEGARIETEIVLPPFTPRPAIRRIEFEVAEARLGRVRSDAERVADGLRELGAASRSVILPTAMGRLPHLLGRERRRLAALVTGGENILFVLDLGAPDQVRSPLGLAVDIGTSTVVAALVDIETGAVIDRASRFNQQILRADDVASRIAQCTSEENVHALQQLVTAHTINPLAEELCERNGCRSTDIVALTVAGNTVMSHLFLGLSPQHIGQVPFTPVAREFPEFPAAQIGLCIHPAARVYVLPCASGYIGGDIVADLHVSNFSARSGACLLIDIGTNGEMALVENGKLLACATAAGPAFEGAGMMHGCRAVAGAIEHMHFTADLLFHCEVVGGGQPLGFCGSAAIDFIACGMGSGLINEMGRFDLDLLKARGRYQHVRVWQGWSHACRVVDAEATSTGEPLVITELDIAQVLKAKAAIYAGLKTLLQLRKRRPRDLDRVILAGGFAKHLRLANAIRIGLLPPLPLDRYEIIGNGSLAGAVLALADTSSRDTYHRLIDTPEVVELNLISDFATFFSDALALPYLEPDEFE